MVDGCKRPDEESFIARSICPETAFISICMLDSYVCICWMLICHSKILTQLCFFFLWQSCAHVLVTLRHMNTQLRFIKDHFLALNDSFGRHKRSWRSNSKHTPKKKKNSWWCTDILSKMSFFNATNTAGNCPDIILKKYPAVYGLHTQSEETSTDRANRLNSSLVPG